MIVIGVLLAGLTWFTFLPVLNHEFVNYDDDVYVYENALVTRGLTTAGIVAAFTKSHAGNWHPLTTLSHMADCEFSGLNAGAHHRTNLLLHIATVVFLFVALRQLTLSMWSSAVVAALFAVHPLRVESVAWVAERKDVLSGLFFALTLWAYARYVRGPKSIARYAIVVLVFALGLMCKPMLVTLPFVLLLLDYWPLRRLGLFATNRPATVRRLVVEKLPLLLLSLVVCVVTILVQQPARQSTEVLSLGVRLNNAVVSYAAYLGACFYPAKLAVFYPYPPNGGAGAMIIVALLLLIGISTAAFWWRKERPYFLVGWLWYLGMLVPVIGLVQVGTQARADRYTYLPQIGVGLALVWFVAELSAAWRHRRIALAVVSAVTLITLSALARQQTQYWQSSETLWTRTLACTSSNAVAESNLANALFKQGRLDEAFGHFQTALEIKPDYGDAHNGIGFILLQRGKFDPAIGHFQRALETRSDSAAAHNNLGLAFLQTGRTAEAIPHLESALKTNPIQPETHNNLGYALLQTGQVEAAVMHYQRALELKPDYAGADNNLAWVLATHPKDAIRNGNRAVELAKRAVQLSGGNNLITLRTLAASLAEAGKFSEAVQVAGQALQLATTQGSAAMAGTLRREIALYQSGQSLRDPVKSQ
ncbi:MAG: tetratricopeptide repeat protein [Verrucomicrobiota bacterium]